VEQNDRRAVPQDLHLHPDPSQLNALFDWFEPQMRPESALDLSISLHVGHVNPFLRSFDCTAVAA
jgi:hypothetical protein